MSAMDLPMLMEAVAAGEGALSTWTMRGASGCGSRRRAGLGLEGLGAHPGAAAVDILLTQLGQQALQGLHKGGLGERAVDFADAHLPVFRGHFQKPL